MNRQHNGHEHSVAGDVISIVIILGVTFLAIALLGGCHAPDDTDTDTATGEHASGLLIEHARLPDAGLAVVEVGYYVESWQTAPSTAAEWDHLGPLFLDEHPMTVAIYIDLGDGNYWTVDYWDVSPSSALPEVAPWGESVTWVGANGSELTLTVWP